MGTERVTKVVRQYSALPIPRADMDRLCRIAEDCRKVKNEVYQRYGGVRGLGKILQPYLIQNEMTATRLRVQLGLPATYFYPAVFEAVADIKSQWAQERFVLARRVRSNGNLTKEDKHFLRFVQRIEEAFSAVMAGEAPRLRGELQARFDAIAAKVDPRRLGSYLRRQMRAIHGRPHTDVADGFTVRTDGYRYRDHGIDLATKERRKRMFIPLTDGNAYGRQLYIRLRPEAGAIEIHAPIDVRVKRHADYQNAVGVSMGAGAMLVTCEGRAYGEELQGYRERLDDWLRREPAGGGKKREAGKARLEQHIRSYINRELNRFLQEEKPAAVCLLRMSRRGRTGADIGGPAWTWQGGYIRKQLELKCRENGVILVEAAAKGSGLADLAERAIHANDRRKRIEWEKQRESRRGSRPRPLGGAGGSPT